MTKVLILGVNLTAAVLVLVIAVPVAQAQTFTVLHAFTGAGDGAYPTAGLTTDHAGNLYGTTGGFGSDYGTVFKLSRHGSGWVFTALYNFQGGTDGATPEARVVFGPDGTLYGTTNSGGAGFGTVFNLRPPATFCRSIQCPWIEAVLYRFTGGSDGANPDFGDLTFDSAGSIYGTTQFGGTGYGTVFRLRHSGGQWTEDVLYSFRGQGMGDGANPYNGVIFDSAGNLYGTTYAGGGGNNAGTVYELQFSDGVWTETILFRFGLNGAGPWGGLIFDQQGNLYGTTYSGGQQNNGGTVYELQPANGGWVQQVLAVVGTGPRGTPTMDASGNLYGSEGGDDDGSVFKLTPGSNGWTYTNLHTFTGGSDGGLPEGVVVLDSSGNAYGTAFFGGYFKQGCTGSGCGVVWEITP